MFPIQFFCMLHAWLHKEIGIWGSTFEACHLQLRIFPIPIPPYRLSLSIFSRIFSYYTIFIASSEFLMEKFNELHFLLLSSNKRKVHIVHIRSSNRCIPKYPYNTQRNAIHFFLHFTSFLAFLLHTTAKTNSFCLSRT